MPTPQEIVNLIATAGELARLGGATARRRFGGVTLTRKADDTPVTEADHLAQAALLDVLAERFPDHAVLAEEEIARPRRHAPLSNAEYCWVIDPIDGTRNYARGIAVYATAVAVMHSGVPIAGAIHDAATDMLYSAGLGHGAFRDDAPLRLVDRPIDADTIVLISSFRDRPVDATIVGWMGRFNFRSLGSLCTHFAWVAAGFADAAHAIDCKLWDVAAGALIIEEAGGIVTRASGATLWPVDVTAYAGESIAVLAGKPSLHARLLSDLRRSGATEVGP